MMIIFERLNGTKQCVLLEYVRIIDHVYGTTRFLYQNSYMLRVSFGGEELFYDILKYIKSGIDICVQERDDDLYTIVELNKLNRIPKIK